MYIDVNNSPQNVFDKHMALKCPNCNAYSNITAISIPRYEFVHRFKLQKVGVVYRCDACNSPVFMKFDVVGSSSGLIDISERGQLIERAQETFEYKYLPAEVANDFREALACYSIGAYNAFAAMCRRTIQSASTALGAAGGDKVLSQLKDLKDVAQIDHDTFEALKQIVITGHDGAHPHLPALTGDRADILLELMKDVLQQIFVRKGKIQEAIDLRKGAIHEKSQKEAS